jgi:uncharacterized membrane protein
MNQGLLVFFLRNFWRLLFSALGLCLGLLWAIFGLKKTLLIFCVGGLGFYFGKWLDEGRPNGGVFRFLRKYLD